MAREALDGGAVELLRLETSTAWAGAELLEFQPRVGRGLADSTSGQPEDSQRLREAARYRAHKTTSPPQAECRWAPWSTRLRVPSRQGCGVL